MKKIKILVTVIALVVCFQGVAQSKFKEINFKVQGNCGMCEKRIENALDLKGIKVADWNVKTKTCRVVYKTSVFKEDEIHQIVANLGHSTDKIKANKESYDKLHSCCKY